MKINWTITKKRGNFRPSLNYKITLEAFEKELAVNAITLKSTIPAIPDPHQGFCLPGTNERTSHWKASDFHYLSVPYFKRGEASGFIRLPFRESREYPEIAASFQTLREEYEAVVRQAYGQEPLHLEDELEMSRGTKQEIAATITAATLFNNFANRSRGQTPMV
ncbi:MAG: hypothetical protein GY737_04130 [Desulfobacteraceae bacterium]|nr:hypothetical protein [Desulfobacteraceae bacterium]